MYNVIFKRKDNQPDEIYTYASLEEARYHFNLFSSSPKPQEYIQIPAAFLGRIHNLLLILK